MFEDSRGVTAVALQVPHLEQRSTTHAAGKDLSIGAKGDPSDVIGRVQAPHLFPLARRFENLNPLFHRDRQPLTVWTESAKACALDRRPYPSTVAGGPAIERAVLIDRFHESSI